MIVAGLDLSISSTGICIYDTISHVSKYYIIGNKFTKKSLNWLNGNCTFITPMVYNKYQYDKRDEYYIKETAKTNNAFAITSLARDIIEYHKPFMATIEGVSLGSSGSVADLVGLNYMIRMMLHEEKVNNIYIVAPTQNKKYATGNGQAEKDVMISAWRKADRSIMELPDFVKVDDIADAYFLARYGQHLFVNK